MIAKLYKHEVLRTWRWLAALTAGAVLVVAITALMGGILPTVLSTTLAVVGVVVAVVYPFAVQLLISLDFYRSSYSKTGYFTASLPVEGSTIFGVKAVYAYLVSLVALLLDLGLVVLAAVGFQASLGVAPGETMRQIGEALAVIADLPAWLLVAFAVILLVLPLTGITPFFFAATVGSESWINRNGFGGVILVWFLFYVAGQILGVASVFLAPFADLNHLPDVSIIYDPVALFTASNDAQYLPLGIFVWMLLMAVIGMWWAKVSYSRKLELR